MKIGRSLVLLSLMVPGVAFSQSDEYSSSERMDFSLMSPCEDGSCAPVILARGTIVGDTDRDFNEFMEVNRPRVGPRTVLYLNSPGGNVVSSLKLGLSIRRAGLDTTLVSSARCLSACVYAFIGGNRRHVQDGARVGVHRFYSTNGPDGNLDDTQRMVALLNDYSISMGVSPGFMRAVSMGSEDRLFPLTSEIARSLDVDNTSPDPKPWSLSPNETGTDMVVVQRASGSDRNVVISLGSRRGTGMLGVVFKEPLQFSSARTASDVRGTTEVIMCRVSARLDVDPSRCVRAQEMLPWNTDEERVMFSSVFEINLERVARNLSTGLPTDQVVISVHGEGLSKPVLLVQTQARNFSQALRALSATISAGSP